MGSLAVAWLELTVRWIHVIAGVAWIGTSFYFNWLNDRLTTPTDAPEGVTGELWSVHGGGFYRVMKFGVAPARMPEELHWFKWEAYLTALSGLALLVLVYYLGADVYMVVPGGLSPGAAVGVGVATLIGGWLVYDALCRSPLGRRTPALAAVGFLLATLIAWGLVQFIGSRAAYIHIGAMLGTIMALNVFRVIIPAQREMVADLVAGREPDGAVGEHAALRSLHNNYMTLPVLFIMVSIHYAMTYGHRYNWAILAALALIGAGTRHYFNLRNRGRHNAWILPGAALAMVALAFVSSGLSRPRLADREGGEIVSFEAARAVIVGRCAACHSEQPSHALFDAPPAGVMFDTPELIRAYADRIYATVVESTVMPLGNFTEMTDEERALIAAWIRQGAEIE